MPMAASPMRRHFPGQLAFGEAFDAADDDVGAEAARIVAEGFDCSVGGDEKWEDVEAL